MSPYDKTTVLSEALKQLLKAKKKHAKEKKQVRCEEKERDFSFWKERLGVIIYQWQEGTKHKGPASGQYWPLFCSKNGYNKRSRKQMIWHQKIISHIKNNQQMDPMQWLNDGYIFCYNIFCILWYIIFLYLIFSCSSYHAFFLLIFLSFGHMPFIFPYLNYRFFFFFS